MKMLLLALGAVAILGGGGAGAYFYFKNPAEASVTGKEEAKDEKTVKHDKEGDGHGKKLIYVKMDPLNLPIVDETGISQIVSLVVSLEVGDTEHEKRIREIMPRIQDAYIQNMYGILNQHAALKGGIVQVGMIKERLHQITEKVVGEGAVNEVLLQVVNQRPM